MLFYQCLILDEAPDTGDDSDDLVTSYISGVGGHPIIRVGSPTTGGAVDSTPILGEIEWIIMYMRQINII